MSDLVQRLRDCDSVEPMSYAAVLIDEAADRIAELEADRGKWRNECLAANESERKLFQRQAELEAEVARLTALNDGNKEIAGKLVVEKFDLLERIEAAIDTAWNDAIEMAAHLIECDGDAMGGKSGAAAAVRALRR